MAPISVDRSVRLSFGHGSAGPPGSVFGLIRTGWRAPPIRFAGRPLRHQRPLAAPAAGGLDGPDGHVELAVGHLLDPQRVEQLAPVGAERRQQHVDGAHAAQGRPRLGVELRHQDGAVAPRQPVEAYAPALGQQLAQLDVVALAAALLLGLAYVAVVDRAAPGDRVERGALDSRAVGELGAVVGQEQGEQPRERIRRRLLQLVEPRLHRLRRLAGHQQRELEPERPQVQCEQAPAVGPEPYHGVHLAGAGALLLGKPHEGGEGARLAVRRRPRRLRARPGLVAALPAQVEVAHPGVAARYPPVYGRRRGADLAGPCQRYLLGRQPPGHVAPDQPHRVLEPGLVPVDADSGLAQLCVGERLRPGRRVLAAPHPAAAVAQVSAAVAAARPRQQLGAGVVGDAPHPLALARALGHGAVAGHLVGHRRGRPAQLAGHPPARPPPLQAVLYRRAFGSVQPAVPLLPSLSLHGSSFLSGGPCALASGKALSQTQPYMSD